LEEAICSQSEKANKFVILKIILCIDLDLKCFKFSYNTFRQFQIIQARIKKDANLKQVLSFESVEEVNNISHSFKKYLL
jgi:hypothetical protein